MTAPTERTEALALAMVARGAGKHAVDGVDGVQEAEVTFEAGELGAVKVTMVRDGKPVAEYRFAIAPPAPATAEKPAPAAKPKTPTPAEKAEEALPALRQAVAERPEDADAWHNLGNALLAAGKSAEAVDALEKSVELAPGNFCSQFDLGVAHGELGRHADAEKWFGGIAEADPQLAQPHSHIGVRALQNLAVAQSRQGREREALETLKPAAKLAWSVLAQLGAHAMDAGRHGEALDYFFGAMAFGPANADVMHGLGRSLLRVGRDAEAEMWLRRASQAAPEDVPAHYDLGLALARQGKRIEARRAFRATLRIDMRHAWSWYDLGCLDALDGKRDAAFRNLRRAARLGLNNVAHANADGDLKALRRDPRWPGLVEQMRRAEPRSASA
ncbi:MAG: tetratricopeptide repeat protein [Planctomycetes bacterium]|nr:tetratricopeptide repeat protein [Planctomycetota bacterium]